MGIKPLYYWLGGDGNIAFASEGKALLKIPAISKDIDFTALGIFFGLLYIPESSSIWADIRKLEPGHYLEWEDGRARDIQYWSITGQYGAVTYSGSFSVPGQACAQSNRGVVGTSFWYCGVCIRWSKYRIYSSSQMLVSMEKNAVLEYPWDVGLRKGKSRLERSFCLTRPDLGGWINSDVIENLLRNNLEDSPEALYAVWAILVFEVWYAVFVGGGGLKPTWSLWDLAEALEPEQGVLIL